MIFVYNKLIVIHTKCKNPSQYYTVISVPFSLDRFARSCALPPQTHYNYLELPCKFSINMRLTLKSKHKAHDCIFYTFPIVVFTLQTTYNNWFLPAHQNRPTLGQLHCIRLLVRRCRGGGGGRCSRRQPAIGDRNEGQNLFAYHSVAAGTDQFGRGHAMELEIVEATAADAAARAEKRCNASPGKTETHIRV